MVSPISAACPAGRDGTLLAKGTSRLRTPVRPPVRRRELHLSGILIPYHPRRLTPGITIFRYPAIALTFNTAPHYNTATGDDGESSVGGGQQRAGEGESRRPKRREHGSGAPGVSGRGALAFGVGKPAATLQAFKARLRDGDVRGRVKRVGTARNAPLK